MHRLSSCASVLIAIAACGGTSPPAAEPRSGAAEPPGAGEAPAEATASASAAASASATVGPGAGAPGTPLPPSALSPMATALQGVAVVDAPGAHPVGGVFGGQLAEGQALEQPINIQPGACYTIVGVAEGIDDLSLQLVMDTPPLPPSVLAQSAGTGSTAVIGGHASGCWKNPTPLGAPGKVIVVARHGAGLAAAQVYLQ